MITNRLRKQHLTPLGLATLAATLLASAGLSAPSAEAATSCKLTNDTLQVTMTENNDYASFATANGTIGVIGKKFDPIVCQGGTPTVKNINSVLIIDNSTDPKTKEAFDGDTHVNISEPGLFAPGKADKPGGEIKWYTDLKGGNDELAIGSSYRAFQWKFGNDGANWSFDDDADLVGMQFDELRVFGGTQNDSISFQGDWGTGAPLSTAKKVYVKTSLSDDEVIGSNIPGGDDIEVEDGNDTVDGAGGNDQIRGYSGNDTIKGGAGNDRVSFKNGPAAGVNVDLGKTGPQDTGEGRDTISEIETVVGTTLGDTITGDGGANLLLGDGGDDTIDGAGGQDDLRGEAGTDTVSYEKAAGSVNVDLTAGRSLGAENDKLEAFENAIGSPFADTLTGTPLANRLVGGAGTDTINAGAGADRVEVRDGEADAANCGADADTAITDRVGVDTLTDCETVDALPEPGTDQPRTTDTDTPDRIVRVSLAGATAQRVLTQKSVRVVVGCGAEACTTVASGAGKGISLKPIQTRLPAGAKRTVKWRLSKAQLASLRTALAKGKRPAVTVTVQAQDTAGNKATRTLKVTAKA
jgi:Ca2+-binding RTX toxin-like protein